MVAFSKGTRQCGRYKTSLDGTINGAFDHYHAIQDKRGGGKGEEVSAERLLCGNFTGEQPHAG